MSSTGRRTLPYRRSATYPASSTSSGMIRRRLRRLTLHTEGVSAEVLLSNCGIPAAQLPSVRRLDPVQDLTNFWVEPSPIYVDDGSGKFQGGSWLARSNFG